MTRGRLIARVAQKIGLSIDEGSNELLLLQEWVDEGVVDVLLKTHCYVELGDMVLTPGVSDYRTDSSILAVVNDRITSQNERFMFDVVPMQTVLEYEAASDLGDTTVRYVAFEGNLMKVWPAPSTADTIRYYYVPRPVAMTDDANDPSNPLYGGIPTEHHLAIEYYMLWQAAEYDDKEHALTPQDYRTIYVQKCVEVRKAHRQKAGRGLSRARVGYPNTPRAGRRNDVYPER